MHCYIVRYHTVQVGNATLKANKCRSLHCLKLCTVTFFDSQQIDVATLHATLFWPIINYRLYVSDDQHLIGSTAFKC
jgi:hypothetical protein